MISIACDRGIRRTRGLRTRRRRKKSASREQRIGELRRQVRYCGDEPRTRPDGCVMVLMARVQKAVWHDTGEDEAVRC